ncbi:MAG: hypothetical protein LBS19_15990 [Clostridiales bacterium]|jgi:predicted nuclease with TOPRIM domain|nr:hypothetical protein [Clostridiales bacterium]
MERLKKDYAEIIGVLTDTSALDKEISSRQSELDVVNELIRKLIEENARTTLPQDIYIQRYDELAARYQAAQNRIKKIAEEKQGRAVKRHNISRFLSDLEVSKGFLTEFDEGLWSETVDFFTVYSERDATVTFMDGSEVHVDLSAE